jgi:hypothetical protein
MFGNLVRLSARESPLLYGFGASERVLLLFSHGSSREGYGNLGTIASPLVHDAPKSELSLADN